MRIGELARRSGLTRDTIRFYEREGLVTSQPSVSDTNSYRDYPEDLVDRLEMIGEAQEAGLPLADLKVLLDTMEGRAHDGLDIDAFLDLRIAQVTQTISRARRCLQMLRATRDALLAASTAQPNTTQRQNQHELP